MTPREAGTASEGPSVYTWVGMDKQALQALVNLGVCACATPRVTWAVSRACVRACCQGDRQSVLPASKVQQVRDAKGVEAVVRSDGS